MLADMVRGHVLAMQVYYVVKHTDATKNSFSRPISLHKEFCAKLQQGTYVRTYANMAHISPDIAALLKEMDSALQPMTSHQLLSKKRHG